MTYNEAVEVLKENQLEHYHIDIDEYKEIDITVRNMAIQALEKQIPKKINSSCVDGKIIGGYCPNCNGTVRIEDTFLTRAKGQCCTWCGQKLEW